MPTSLSRSELFSHTGEPIADGTLGYIRSRQKRRMFSLLTEAFQKSGLTQAQLARRLKMDRALVSRYLGTPANWEFETLCDLIFGICGGVLNPELAFPAGDKGGMETVQEKELEAVSRAAQPPPGQRGRPPKTLLGPEQGRADDPAMQMRAA